MNTRIQSFDLIRFKLCRDVAVRRYKSVWMYLFPSILYKSQIIMNIFHSVMYSLWFVMLLSVFSLQNDDERLRLGAQQVAMLQLQVGFVLMISYQILYFIYRIRINTDIKPIRSRLIDPKIYKSRPPLSHTCEATMTGRAPDYNLSPALPYRWSYHDW